MMKRQVFGGAVKERRKKSKLVTMMCVSANFRGAPPWLRLGWFGWLVTLLDLDEWGCAMGGLACALLGSWGVMAGA